MKKTIRHFIRQESGTAAMEYGLLVAVISVSVIGAGEVVSTSLTELFQQIADKLDAIIASAL